MNPAGSRDCTLTALVNLPLLSLLGFSQITGQSITPSLRVMILKQMGQLSEQLVSSNLWLHDA